MVSAGGISSKLSLGRKGDYERTTESCSFSELDAMLLNGSRSKTSLDLGLGGAGVDAQSKQCNEDEDD